MESPTNSQQTVSDDDEIDYSVKPEFYDSDLDDKDEIWMAKKRDGRVSDACFTTVCLECQSPPNNYCNNFISKFVGETPPLPAIALGGASTKVMESPTNSQKTVSDDDEIDYSVKPEFYDSDLDDKDEIWMAKKRDGRVSDAVLSCPACFTTVCLECQRHDQYVTQYRAVFVVNCKVDKNKVLQQNAKPAKVGKRTRDSEKQEETVSADNNESVNPVSCSTCSTEIGVVDSEEIYHFFNVIPSEP